MSFDEKIVDVVDCSQGYSLQEYPCQKNYKTAKYHIIRFRSESEFNEYDEDVKRINTLANEINVNRESGAMNEASYRNITVTEWVPLVEVFVRKWSEIRVPEDIQNVYNNVFNELKLDRVKEKQVWSHRQSRRVHCFVPSK